MFVTVALLKDLGFSFKSALEVGADDDFFRRCFPHTVHYWCDQNIKDESLFTRSTFQEFLSSSEMFDLIFCGHTIEHFIDQGDKEFIDFLDKKLTEKGLAIVEPLFIQAQPLSIWHHSISNPTSFEGELVVQDATTNFPGSPDHGMGFGRIYSPYSLKQRLLSKSTNLEFELIEIEGMSGPVPDMSRFKYSRSELNSPLRLLLAKRRSPSPQ